MDSNYLTPIINNKLIPKLRNLGIEKPTNLRFTFLNSEEDEMIKDKQLDLSVKMSEIAKNLIGTGYEIDRSDFETRTGLKLSKSAIPAPNAGF